MQSTDEADDDESRPHEDRSVRVEVSPGFAQWLAESGGSVAVTTYQAGKVALAGWDPARSCVHFTMRNFPRPMGMAVDGPRMALATANELLLLTDAPLLAADYTAIQSPPLGGGGKGVGLPSLRHDALYLPRVAYQTGPLNLHDLAFAGDALWAVNTRFGCLMTPSAEFSFVPRWQPKFLSTLAPEDRCHLNGLAMVHGAPGFVTALGATDTPRGWAESKATGGVLIDVASNEVVMKGLCMPHSPRWHEGKLWLLNSGRGELCVVDPDRGNLDVVAALPGYARGLHFVGRHALIGLSKVRKKHVFAGLPVQERFPELLCAVAVVDTRSGKNLGMLTFTEAAEELYDVAFLPGVHTPTILSARRDETRQAITAPGFSYWLETRDEPRPA